MRTATGNGKFQSAIDQKEFIMTSDSIVARIEANPKYHELRRKRNVFG